MEIPDLKLTDQNGKKVRLYTDLIKDKVVVLNFFFTSCVNVCLSQGFTLKTLKAQLGGRLGKEVFFISISKDPTRDTPARLKRWGNQFGATNGWSLLTGDEEGISKLVLGLTGEEAASGDHSPVLIIGNDRTGVWGQSSGDSLASELVEVIESVVRPVAVLRLQ